MRIQETSFVIIFLLLMTSCNHHFIENSQFGKEKAFRVEGRISGADSGWLYLGTYDTSGRGPISFFDSTKIINSIFQFKGKLTSPMPCKIKMKDLVTGYPFTHFFILDTGLTMVHLYKDSMGNSTITGAKSQEIFTAFNKRLYDSEISFQKDIPLYHKGIINSDSFNKLEEAFYDNKTELFLQQVKANPSSIISAFIVKNNLNYDIDIPALKEIYNSFANKDNYYARSLLDYLKVLIAKSKLVIGVKAPKFIITDINNRKLTNKTFKGKYLLIDFWASWCAPCREENPFLVAAYKKFSSQGLKIISISGDVNRDDWEYAIGKDGLTWIQVCDFEGPKSKIARDFGISSIPANFLINKKGKIIAKNLRGKDIEKELLKIFK